MKAHIPNHPGYFATIDGEIISHRAGRVRNLSRRKRINGYPVVSLYTHWTKKPKHRFVHNLVLEAFIGPRPHGYQAAHLNGIRHDSRLSNLAWVTVEENVRQRAAHGNDLCGEDHPDAKLKAKDIQAICELRRTGKSYAEIGKAFGVSLYAIRDVCSGDTWKHITRPKD